MNRTGTLLTCIVFFLSFCVNTMAEAAVVRGRVVDDSGKAVSLAAVSVAGTGYVAKTDDEGLFEIQDIEEGRQTVIVEHASQLPIYQTVMVPLNKPLLLSFGSRKTYTTDAIVVTATRTPRSIKDAPLPVMLIDRNEIEDIQAVSAADALKHELGITLMPNGFTRQSVSIHGLPETYSLLLLDGQRVYGRHADAKDFDHVPASMIEQIELIKGPSSVLYGSDAVAGIVNVITRKGSDKLEGEALMTAGNYENRHAQFGLGGPAGPGRHFLSGSFTSSRQMQEGYGYDNFSVRYNGEYDLAEQMLLKIGAGFFNEESEDMVALDVSMDGGHRGGPYLKDRVSDVHVGLEYKMDSLTTLQASMYAMDQDRVDNRPPLTRQEREWDRQHYRFEGIVSHRMGEDEVVAGIEGRREQLEQTEVAGSPSQNLGALFVQYTWAAMPDLELVGAGRLEYHEKWGWVLVPRAGIALSLGDDIRILASGGTSYRAPTLENMFVKLNYHPWGGGFYSEGNPDLEPEKGIGGNIDIEWVATRDLVVTAGIFATKLKDRIALVSSGETIDGVDLRKRVNIDEALSYGTEIKVDWNVLPTLSLGGSYSYVHTEDKPSGEPFALVPYHKADVKFQWNSPGEITGVVVRTSYIGKRKDSRSRMYDPAIVADVSVEQRLGQGFSLLAAVDNVFAEDLFPYDSYVLHDRNWRLGLRYVY